MIKNDAGEVAVVYYSPVDKQVQVGQKTYIFMVNRAISFAWVKEEDVNGILAIKGGCNCPNSSHLPAFHLANDAQTRIWNNWASR